MEVFWEYVRAFLCGGVLCLIGQILIDKTALTPAKILVIYVVSGVILGGLGVYKYVVEFGGAGATVPLTGFGYLLAILWPRAWPRPWRNKAFWELLPGASPPRQAALPPPSSSAIWYP